MEIHIALAVQYLQFIHLVCGAEQTQQCTLKSAPIINLDIIRNKTVNNFNHQTQQRHCEHTQTPAPINPCDSESSF